MEPLLPTTEGRQAAPPCYRSQKEVWALRIARVELRSGGGVLMEFADAVYAPLAVEAKVVHRYMPIAGDYLMIYRDGYRSISPRGAFEEGYERVS